MAESNVNHGKRRFLIGATSVVGGIGVVAAATPFLISLAPSERARAAGAPVEVDIGKLEPGQKIDVEWRGKVVWIVNRTQDDAGFAPEDRRAPRRSAVGDAAAARLREERDALDQAGGLDRRRASARTSAARPTFRPDVAPADLGPDWLGGFFCPCHQSKFDLAGRVFKGVPAPTNLVVPPHKYLTDTRIVDRRGRREGLTRTEKDDDATCKSS